MTGSKRQAVRFPAVLSVLRHASLTTHCSLYFYVGEKTRKGVWIMAFCVNCGTKMEDVAKLCPSCGTPVGGVSPTAPKPAVEKVGSIRKCPACGAEVPAMAAICPSCGHEFSGVRVANSVQEFFQKLQAVTNDQQRISLIESFPVPNAKEDIFEFIIMASSQLKPMGTLPTLWVGYVRLLTFGIWPGPIVNKYNKAWETKIKQAYGKGKIAFAGDKNSLAQVEAIVQDVDKAKKKRRTSILVALLSYLLFCFVSFNAPSVTANAAAKAEEKRFEILYDEIMTDIKNNNLLDAKMKAIDLDPKSYENRIWDQKREAILQEIENLQAQKK
jgi:RNA polymerase subunit RPABC4/transcription elongation factor Spt4